MTSERTKMSHHDLKGWARFFDQEVAAGRSRKVRGMIQVEDAAGGWYQRNANSCCGCGHSQQGATGRGNKNRADMPPTLDRRARGRYKHVGL